MYINGLADAFASDKYGGHVYEMTRVSEQDGKTVRAALFLQLPNLWRAARCTMAACIVGMSTMKTPNTCPTLHVTRALQHRSNIALLPNR